MIPSGLVKIFLTQNLKARRVKSRLICLALQSPGRTEAAAPAISSWLVMQMETLYRRKLERPFTSEQKMNFWHGNARVICLARALGPARRRARQRYSAWYTPPYRDYTVWTPPGSSPQRRSSSTVNGKTAAPSTLRRTANLRKLHYS